MNELIRYDKGVPTVSGRELHAALEIKTAYKDWFPRMCEYGFEEGRDFSSILLKSTDGSRTFTFGKDEEHVKMHTFWTQKGRLFMKKDGILPVMEKEGEKADVQV